MAGFLSAMVLAACAGLCPGWSQEQSGSGDPLLPLENGHLVIWVVGPETPWAAAEKARQAANVPEFRAPQPGYHEQTTGNFGQDASSYGTSASNYGVDASSSTISVPKAAESPGYGSTPPPPNTPAWRQYHEQTAGSFGQDASNYGTTASNHGEDLSRLGQTASSYGTDASNAGQTAGSFGNTLSTIADAGSHPTSTKAPVIKEPRSALAEELAGRLREAFPDLQVQYVDVSADGLKTKLMNTTGAAYPDLLVGSLPGAWWNGMQSEFGVAMLRPAVFVPDGLPVSEGFSPQIEILTHAGHMAAARAFVMWMSDGGGACVGCGTQRQTVVGRNAKAAEAVATDALSRLVGGGSLGEEADPEMAGVSAQLARRMLMTTAGSMASESAMHIDVERASADGKLAAVALRVVASSEQVFGVLHPLIVLRQGSDGSWRVLQVSLNLPEEEQLAAQRALMESAPPSQTEVRAGVKGVSLAAPLDGAQSGPLPVLWWDNGGGAGLQVVEWQFSPGTGWSDSRLYLVPDSGATLRTQVTAQFAAMSGRYRWRVWSVGARGAMKISVWRTFGITK